MIKDAFTIEFTSAISNSNKSIKRDSFKYQAAIQMLSKSFNLFHVSKIRRITNDGMVGLSGTYYLTTYPLSNCKHYNWKDAVTLDSDNFLQDIGNTIDEYLSNAYC